MRDPSVDGALNIIGVGGVGCKVVEQLAADPLSGVRYLGIDTQEATTHSSNLERLVLAGQSAGSGRAAQIAYAAAQRSANEITAALEQNEFALIIGSFGGGTGAGASPVVAKCSRSDGGLAVIIALEPLEFEGDKRTVASKEAINFALSLSDAVIRVPNRDVSELYGSDVSAKDVLRRMNQQIAGGIHALMEIAAGRAQMSLDLGVLRRALVSSGFAVLGVGEADGAGGLERSLRRALSSSFLYPEELRRATQVLVFVRGGEELPIEELQAASRSVAEFVGDAELLVGLGPAQEEQGKVTVTLIGCGVQEVVETTVSQGSETVQGFDSTDLFDGQNLEIPAFIRRKRQHYRA